MKKFVLTILTGLSISLNAAAIDFTCRVTSDNKQYDDLFLVHIDDVGANTISYQRLENGTYSGPTVIDGCDKAQLTTVSPVLTSLVCADEGEEGSVDIETKTGVGTIYFYLPKIGYGERTLLDIKCVVH